jgi:DNA-binding transcriptional regulator YiaG
MTGEEIKNLRLGLGESQTKFAARFGVSYMTVGKWEKGLFKPLPTFDRMLRAIKIQQIQQATPE